ncbi:MAG: hypothetical protein ACE5GB_00280 [Acidimicrobiales bacterium]
MDLLDILRMLRRRWITALLTLTAGAALFVLAAGAVEEDWDAKATVVLQGPFQEVEIDEIGQENVVTHNPLLDDGSVGSTGQILGIRATSQQTRRTFAINGLSSDYEVGYRDRDPFLSLAVTDADPAVAVATIDAIIDFLELELTTRQDAANVDDVSRVTLDVLSETEVAANLTNQRRVLGVIVVLTLGTAVVAAAVVDSIRGRHDRDHRILDDVMASIATQIEEGDPPIPAEFSRERRARWGQLSEPDRSGTFASGE